MYGSPFDGKSSHRIGTTDVFLMEVVSLNDLNFVNYNIKEVVNLNNLKISTVYGYNIDSAGIHTGNNDV